jgi:hypothetical protein
MPTRILRALAVAAAVYACAGSAQAITCYIVFDKNENVIYRDIFPPVDMSARGDAARDAMRRRGEFLMFVDVERCPQVEFLFGNAGETALDFARTGPASLPMSSVTPPPAAAKPMIQPATKP